MTTTTTSPINMTKIIPLVTGGGSGIGFGFVEEFLKRGAPKVLITGRRENVLQEAAAKYPDKIYYLVNDTGNAADREALLDWVKTTHPDCNALVNNAGIQRRFAPAEDTASWEERATEIEINFAGPVHLCTIFIPWFLSKPEEECLLANVSSGLAFIPLTSGPVYSATKAAIHNYTMAIRYSLEETNVRVVEIVPPAVKSNLGGSHDFGEDCDEYCAATMDRVQAGENEVGFRFSDMARTADRTTIVTTMNNLANMMHTTKYSAVPKKEE